MYPLLTVSVYWTISEYPQASIEKFLSAFVVGMGALAAVTAYS